jgi:hypothetical protein
MMMKHYLKRGGRLVSALVATVILAVAPFALLSASGYQQVTTISDVEDTAVTATSVRIQTDKMKRFDCTGWIFTNTGATTVYINVNNDTTPATTTLDQDNNPIEAGKRLYFEDHLIKQYRVIGTGGETLIHEATCYP